MRFIVAIIEDTNLAYVAGPTNDYTLISYIDAEVENLSLVELNRSLNMIKKLKKTEIWDLPLLDNLDYDSLQERGYSIIRRVNSKLYEHRWVVMFDLAHYQNANLLSILRDRKLNELL
mgnify:CR=1 FL=1